jgi:hypothetical protein
MLWLFRATAKSVEIEHPQREERVKGKPVRGSTGPFGKKLEVNR